MSIFLHLRITANSAGGIGGGLSVKRSNKKGVCFSVEVSEKRGCKKGVFSVKIRGEKSVDFFASQNRPKH